MKRIWKILRGQRVEKPLDAIQIEVSSACNLRCKFCPTTYLNNKEKRFLYLEDVKRLEPYLKMSKWVYLQGWGEPLLNKEIWDITELVKGTSAKVGFTTNGTFLTEEVISKIIEYEVDLISTSIAGATNETHGKLRVNSQLSDIINSIKLLVNAKMASPKNLPIITLSYMLTNESIHELPEAVKMAFELGVDDFYTTNLDYVFSEDTNESKIFSWEKANTDEYQQIINKAEKYALDHDFPFRTYPLLPEDEKAICDLNPARMVFITSSGDVTPCTYLGRYINPRYYQDQKIILPRKTFGNIHQDDFWNIWNNTLYQEFKNPFIKRAQAYQNLINTYSDFEPNLTKIKDAEKRYLNNLKQNPFPEECKNCPKTFGI